MNVSNKAIFLLVCAAAMDLANPAFAYLDPGTGSMMLQLLLGGVAGALVVLKLYWQNFKLYFRNAVPVHLRKKDK